MNLDRFHDIARRYPALRLAIVGDFCLDRYLDIDPARSEVSIETGLPVHNIVRVRSQPGGAGTILNNLVALGVGEVVLVGMAGEEGEGWELRRALAAMRGVRLDFFHQTAERHTFTYTKPLLQQPGRPPVELNRLDLKNWDCLPSAWEQRLQESVTAVFDQVDAVVLLEQVDLPDTGVLTRGLLETIGRLARQHPGKLVLADSRRGLAHFPPVSFKMNRHELTRLMGLPLEAGLAQIRENAVALARRQGQRVFVTLAEHGLLGADPNGQIAHVDSLPLRGEIDIVGAGDAVTANLATALSAGAGLVEALDIANTAASIVVHQLGTTGTASVEQIAALSAP